MTTRRAVLLSPLLGLLPPALARGEKGAPRLFALVVGIDAYPFVSKLQGCINDASIIADAARPLAAELVTLLDADASRERFLATWDALAEAARPGDRLLVTFSGHGRREPERVEGSKPDGQDETAAFFRFREQAPENGQRVFGQEIGARLEATGRRGVVTWFVADSCYSSGLTRDVDQRAVKPVYRYLPSYDIQDDILAGLAMPTMQPGGQPNLVFLAAGQRNEPVPELLIGGRMHGALSYAFAATLRQAASGVPANTAGEFARAVITSTRQHAEGRHHPAAELTLPEGSPAFAGELPAVQRPGLAPAVSVRVYVLPGPRPASFDVRSSLSGMDAAEVANDAAHSDVVFDPATGHLVSQAGDLLAIGLASPERFRAAVAKVAAVAGLQSLPSNGLEIGLVRSGQALAPGAANSLDLKHPIGEHLLLVVRSPLRGDLVVASIDALGQVALLRPRPGENARLQAPKWQKSVIILEPAGAGHVVALFSAGSLSQAAEALRGLEGAAMAEPFARTVRDLVRGGNVTSAVFGFFS